MRDPNDLRQCPPLFTTGKLNGIRRGLKHEISFLCATFEGLVPSFLPNKINNMRKLFLSLLAICTLCMVGCLETTQEITLNEDGSGTVTNTNDMGALLTVAKQMGAGAEIEKAGDKMIDSTIALRDGVDSIPGLTAEEKDLMRNGTLKLNVDMKNDKFMTRVSIPFTSPNQIAAINKLSTKILTEAAKDKMASSSTQIPADKMPEPSSFDDYYKLEFSNGELTRKVDKDKYAGAESDEYLSGIKQAAAMGLVMKATYVINLPRPAQKAEGKKVKLSDDKKKVTISVDIDDFFDDPANLEFKIKY